MRKSARMASISNFPAMALLWLFPTVFLLLCLMPEDGHAQYGELEYNPERVFRLNGEVSLIYERDWTAGSDALTRFTYYSDLLLSGFVVDPRIMTFQAGGFWGQTFQNPGDTLDSYGLSLRTQFLNDRPKRGPLQFFPQPIELRYSYGKGKFTQTQEYGISLRYNFGQLMKPKGIPPSQQTVSNNTSNTGEEKEPKLSVPGLITWPTLYMDYDRYSYKFMGDESKTDHLSVRAESLTTRAEYFADYEDYKYSDSLNTSLRYLDLQANLHFYNKEKTSNLDIFNRLLLADNQGDRELTFTSAAAWVKLLGPTGRDSVVVTGGGRYFTSSNSSNNYELNLTSSYNKFFSERFSNYASLGLGYGREEDRTVHSEKLLNMLTYSLTPYLRFDNNLSVGYTQDGPLYGVSVGLAALSQRVAASVIYQFDSQDVLTGNTRTQRISLDVNGNFFENMTFFSQNYYRISDVEDMVSPFHEKDLYLSANMMWRIFSSTLSLGASYLRTRTEETGSPLSVAGGVSHNPAVIETAITTYNATLTTLLARRLTLNIYAYYQQEKDGPDSFYVTPMLLWYYRKMTLDAEYTLRIIRRPGNTSKEHRVYVRLTRLIDNTLRPFW